MAEAHVQRFWHSREFDPLLDDDGFLLDPLTNSWMKGTHAIEPSALPSCLVLLGEPGMGKTTILRDCSGEAEVAGRQSLDIDLRSVDSSDAFRDAVFGDPAFQQWLVDGSELELFLDSFDECLAEARTIAAVLAARLPTLPTERLRLRIGCRSADWPQLLEASIKDLWGEGLAVIQLAPLRAADVSMIATARGLDGQAFLDQVQQRGVGPLAARPMTLRLLLAVFREHVALPGSRADLYRDGCLLLCQEQNPSRLASRRISRYTAAQLVACASRIAAATVLCNRFGVAESPQLDRLALPVVTFEDIAGGVEIAKGEEFGIDRDVVQDTVATGLFEPLGEGLHAFAHRSFAEYLAAHYLSRRDFTVKQILDLITISRDDRVVPQMRDMAAWLVEMRPDVRQEIIRRDPLTVARMDAASCSDDDRERIVSSLLEREKPGNLPRFETRRSDFAKLSHPTLAQQLLAHIDTHGTSDVLIDIVAAANVREVADRLVDVVADLSADSELRAKASHALLGLKDPATFSRLKMLLPAGIGDDPYDEIRGCLLRLLWPVNLDGDTLFESLVEPKDDAFFGRYFDFVSKHVMSDLNAASIPAAFRWVARQTDDSPSWFSGLIAWILTIGAAMWRKGYDDSLFPAALLAQLRAQSEILDNLPLPEFVDLVEDSEARHRLVQILVPYLAAGEGYLLIPNARLQLVREDDIPWLIIRIRAATLDEEQHVWAELMNHVLREGSATINDLILQEAKTNPILAEEFRWAFRVVELDSAEADRARKSYRRQTRSTQTVKREETHDDSPLKELFDDISQADEKWWPQVMTLAFNRRDWDLRATLERIVGLTSEATQHKLIDAAERFLVKFDSPADDQIQPRTIHLLSVFGFAAMLLLSEQDRSRFEGLDIAILKKWTPSVVAEAAFDWKLSVEALDTVRFKLQCADIARVVEQFIRIESKLEPDGLHNSLRSAERLWCLEVTSVVMKYLDNSTLRPAAFDTLLHTLLKHDTPGVRRRCEALVSAATESGIDVERALIAARNLMLHSADASWPLVWSFLPAAGASGQALVEEHLELNKIGDFIPKLKDSEIADLVIWLYERHQGAELGLDTFLGLAINDVLDGLRKRGKVEGLRRIQAAFPNRIHEQYILMAQEARQEASWDPPTPEELLALATDRRKRLVHDGEHMVQILVESLERLQAQLHSEDPTAKYLWDGDQPKGECAIRDWIRKFLSEEDTIPHLITNKEVEVFDRFYTDIKIEAAGRGSRRTLDAKVIATIEVKGCWNDELEHAMKTQLVTKYLQGSTSAYGIYLVAWFDADAWTDSDGRKKKCHCWSKSELAEYLESQAQVLSTRGIFVRPFVLDCSIPKATRPRPTKGSKNQ